MLKNYLKVALRNLYKNKSFSFINILGLSIGLAAFILIILYVKFEFSFDKYHNNVASGVYIYQIQAGDFIQSMRMLLIR